MTTRSRTIDPVTLEVIRNRLDSIVREMGSVTLRTARSPVVFSGRDFSCGLLTRRAELLALGTSIAIHIFPVLWQVQKALERVQWKIAPGDMFIGNDPSDGGTHLNDVLIFIPVFHDDELIAFAANRAHWYDVGGMVPGSISGGAREIYQEGLRIPPIRFGRNDEIDSEILELVLRNVRVPHESHGDLMAQVASCRLARTRILELVARYGRVAVVDHFDEILDSSERRLRALIRALPKTRVVQEGYLDNDGVDPEQRRVRVEITVDEDSVHVDYTGTARQSRGPLNVGQGLGNGFAFMGIKAALDPHGPINSGCFRPVKITNSPGTMLNARPPAAGGGMAEMGLAAIYTMTAMSKLAPNQTCAEEPSAANHQNFGGVDERHGEPRPFIYYDYPTGGGGGRATKDGMDYMRSVRSGNVNLMPIEIVEKTYPVRFVRYELRQDSGGPGRFRGGTSVVREYHTASAGILSILGDQSVIPPAGVSGGFPGSRSRFDVLRDGQWIPISADFHSKVTAFRIEAGDVVRMATAGGGGHGDPLERDPALVLNDVIDGKVSVEQAQGVYGVVLDGSGTHVSPGATETRRAELAARRIHLVARRGGEPVLDHGMRVAWVSPGLAEKSGIADGGIAEFFVAFTPNPVRVRTRFRSDVREDDFVLDAEAWSLFNVGDGERVLWRPLG